MTSAIGAELLNAANKTMEAITVSAMMISMHDTPVDMVVAMRLFRKSKDCCAVADIIMSRSILR